MKEAFAADVAVGEARAGLMEVGARHKTRCRSEKQALLEDTNHELHVLCKKATMAERRA